jgi:signal transduction histidine kinase
MRLAPFIRGNTKKIIVEWEAFAATLVPAADDMNSRALRNHISEMLAFVIDDIDAPQTSTEQISKSHGKKAKAVEYSAAETHAALRLAGGFSLDQMVSEFRALRASVTKLWEKQLTEPAPVDIADLIRFNESLDQILTETVAHYSMKLNESKNLFLGILKEDLSESLGLLATAAGLTLRLGRLHERQSMLVSEMGERAIRATQTVAHLRDLTRARLGSGLPVIRQSMDIGFVTKKLADEMRSAHPRREFDVAISGNLEGDWDKARVGQLLANLLGNAVQYGFSASKIGV